MSRHCYPSRPRKSKDSDGELLVSKKYRPLTPGLDSLIYDGILYNTTDKEVTVKIIDLLNVNGVDYNGVVTITPNPLTVTANSSSNFTVEFPGLTVKNGDKVINTITASGSGFKTSTSQEDTLISQYTPPSINKVFTSESLTENALCNFIITVSNPNPFDIIGDVVDIRDTDNFPVEDTTIPANGSVPFSGAVTITSDDVTKGYMINTARFEYNGTFVEAQDSIYKGDNPLSIRKNLVFPSKSIPVGYIGSITNSSGATISGITLNDILVVTRTGTPTSYPGTITPPPDPINPAITTYTLNPYETLGFTVTFAGYTTHAEPDDILYNTVTATTPNYPVVTAHTLDKMLDALVGLKYWSENGEEYTDGGTQKGWSQWQATRATGTVPTDIDAIITPNGTGAIARYPYTSTYPILRGEYAVDLQPVPDHTIPGPIGPIGATGDYSFVAGVNNSASGGASVAMGYKNEASGAASVAMGISNIASGYSSVAMGSRNEASGAASAVMGNNNKTQALCSTVFGQGNTANATATHSLTVGQNLTNPNQHSILMGGGGTAGATGKSTSAKLETLAQPPGNGTTDPYKTISGANSFQIANTNNNIILMAGPISGSSSTTGGLTTNVLSTSGADYAEYFELNTLMKEDDYIGYFVDFAQDSHKVIIADSDPIGIFTSFDANTSLIGDSAMLSWGNRYLKDDFCRPITEYSVKKSMEELNITTIEYKEPMTKEEAIAFSKLAKEKLPQETYDKITIESGPLENPDYDPEAKYIPRTQRPEWALVSLLGKVRVRDDGTCKVGSRCNASKGIAVPGDRWRVMKRISSNVIEILFK